MQTSQGGVNEARYESEAITGSSDDRQIPESEPKEKHKILDGFGSVQGLPTLLCVEPVVQEGLRLTFVRFVSRGIQHAERRSLQTIASAFVGGLCFVNCAADRGNFRFGLHLSLQQLQRLQMFVRCLAQD